MTKGFPSQSKLTQQVYNTLAPFGSDKHGIDVAPKALFEITGLSVAPISSELIRSELTNKNQLHIEFAAGHGLREGDALRFDSGPLQSTEVSVISTPTATTVIAPFIMSNADLIASTCLFMRHITLTLDSAGNLAVTATPVKFVLDGVDTEVNEDTGTPANNTPLPVKITGLTGDINVTARDLNVQLSDLGANYDATRIGDGTNLLAINASLEAQVRDDDAIVELVAANASLDALELQLPATIGSKADVASLSITDSTEGRVIQDAIKTAVESSASGLPTSLGVKTNALSTSVTQSTEDRALTVLMSDDLEEIKESINLIELQLPASLGSKVDAASLAVTQSTEDKVIQVAIKTAVEAIQAVSETDRDVVENYVRRDFASANLLTATGFVTIATLTASIKKINITNNSGNELVIQNATTGIELIVGQGAVFDIALLGVATDLIQMKAITADALEGIIYINFEG